MSAVNFLKKIFNIQISRHIVITIFGIKISWLNRNYLRENFWDVLQTNIMASKVNSELEKYRGIYSGKDIVIVGGGPSVKFFNNIFDPETTVFMGVNHAYKLKSVRFDYLFAQDKFPVAEEMQQFVDYNEDSCTKVIGLYTAPESYSYRFRQSTIAKIKKKLLLVLGFLKMGEIPFDITLAPVADLHGTVFTLLQFALHTQPGNIYLVGFDCNVGHIFQNDQRRHNLTYQKNSWYKIKEHIDKYFENINVISVNPVGLKGLFKDVYTQGYVDAHPELQNGNISILKK